MSLFLMPLKERKINMRFFRLFDALAKMGTGLIAILVSFIAFDNHFFETPENLENYEKLYAAQATSPAVLDLDYEDIEFSLKGIEVETYSVDYSYEVAGKKYTGNYYFDSEEEISSQEHLVYYLPESPEVHQLMLEKELDKARKDASSNMDLYLGLGAILFAILMIFLGIRKFKKNLNARPKQG